MARLSDAQIAGYAKGAGFSGNALTIAVAVALAESGGNPAAHNGNALTGDNSYGLMQINMLGSMGPARRAQYGLNSNDQLFDPAINMRVAYGLSNHGKSFSPWTTYTRGTYRAYLSRAAKAAGNPDTSGSTSGSTGNGSGGSTVTQAGFLPDLSGLNKMIGYLTDPVTWLRVGLIMAGGILLLFGLWKISGESDRIKSALGTVTSAVPQTRAVKTAAEAA